MCLIGNYKPKIIGTQPKEDYMKKRVAMLVSTLALVALAGVAQAATMLAVGTAEQFQVSDAGVLSNGLKVTGNVGIGTLTPQGPIHAVSSGTTIQQGGLTFEFTANGAAPATFIAPNISLFRNNDPTVNAGLPRINDSIGYLNFGSVINSVKSNRAIIYARAEKDWTLTDNASYFQFLVVPAGTTGTKEAMKITSSGTLAVNGGVRIYPYVGATPPAKPTCDASTQGTLWFTKTAGADTLQICADAAGGIQWRNISIP